MALHDLLNAVAVIDDDLPVWVRSLETGAFALEGESDLWLTDRATDHSVISTDSDLHVVA